MKNIAIILCLLLTACSEQLANSDPLMRAQQQGNWAVINYWAEWCKPCITEIPELNSFDQQHPNIEVLGVNYDGETDEVLAQQIKKLNIQFPVLPQDPAPELGIERPQVLPTTVIVNPQGVVVDVLLGPQTEDSLRSAIKG